MIVTRGKSVRGAALAAASANYNRGAATLHALRGKVGDFEAVYEEVSGQDLSALFDVWLRDPVKPTAW